MVLTNRSSTFPDHAIDRNRALIFFGKVVHHAEPRPVPLVVKKGVRTFSRTSGGMPVPVSRIATEA